MSNRLYLISNFDLIPIGIKYRIIADRCDFWQGKSMIESDADITGLESAPALYPNGESTSAIGCIAEWVDTKKIDDEENEKMDKVIDQMLDFANSRTQKFSARLKAKTSKDQTEGLLKADGKPITILNPEGWRK